VGLSGLRSIRILAGASRGSKRCQPKFAPKRQPASSSKHMARPCRLLSLKPKLEYDGVETDFIKELALTIDETDDDVMVTVSYLVAQGLDGNHCRK